MDPVTVSTTIARPREEIFDYLCDVANRPQFTDHYLVDWRLTRVESVGKGAGARFTFKAPRNRFNQADITLVEVEPPRRLVEAGRGGKYNRTRLRAIYELEPASGGQTRVSLTVATQPGNLADRIMEALGFRGWVKRNGGKALRRLRDLLEEGQPAGERISVGGR
jgi:uncharacterized protein YndB with AHSA1/START domain